MTDDERAAIRELIREGRSKYGNDFVIMRVVEGEDGQRRYTPFMKSPDDAREVQAMLLDAGEANDPRGVGHPRGAQDG